MCVNPRKYKGGGNSTHKVLKTKLLGHMICKKKAGKFTSSVVALQAAGAVAYWF